MVFVPTDAAAVTAATQAVAAAERSSAAECEKRGPNCRQREADETTRRAELAVAIAGKAATDRATQLDGETAALTARLDKAPSQRELGSGKLFASVFDLSPIAAASFQLQVFAALIEAIIAAALCLPELMLPRRRVEDVEPDRVPAAIEPPRPQLVTNEAPAASIIDFAAVHLERAKGGKLEFEDFYLAYAAECSAADKRALSPTDAIGPTQRLCTECGIQIKSAGGSKYLMGVRLKALPAASGAVLALMATKKKALGPMARKHGDTA